MRSNQQFISKYDDNLFLIQTPEHFMTQRRSILNYHCFFRIYNSIIKMKLLILKFLRNLGSFKNTHKNLCVEV